MIGSIALKTVAPAALAMALIGTPWASRPASAAIYLNYCQLYPCTHWSVVTSFEWGVGRGLGGAQIKTGVTPSYEKDGSPWYPVEEVQINGSNYAVTSGDGGDNLFSPEAPFFDSYGLTLNNFRLFSQGGGLFVCAPASCAGTTPTPVEQFLMVPEPPTWAMMGLGFAMLGLAAYRGRSRQSGRQALGAPGVSARMSGLRDSTMGLS